MDLHYQQVRVGIYNQENNMKINKFKLYLCIILSITSSAGTSKVFAIDQGFYNSNDIIYYNPECPSSGGTSGALIGNDNLEKILRYYVGKGLTLAQASGIAGNYQQESSFDPAIIQGGSEADENYKPIDGTGFGIAQWTFDDRQLPLVELSKSSNRKIIDLSLQLDYSWQELSGKRSGALVTLKEATTPEDAAYVFHRDFEVSADSEAFVKAVRGANAKVIYDSYQSKIADASVSTTTTATAAPVVVSGSSSCGDTAASAKASQFIDGFAFYNQYDPQWANKSYGSNATIGESGCGPSAMAMIITALTGQTVTPLDTATYGAANGTAANGGIDGSNWNIQTVLGDHWGLKTENISGDVNSINTVLKAGGLVITSGAGSAPFTKGGHYIVIRALTDGGKWLVGDSNGTIGSENNKSEWDPATILNGAAKSNIWSVTK